MEQQVPNGETVDIMTAIGHVQETLQKSISDLSQHVYELTGNMTARVESLEKAQEKAQTRQWIHSSVVIPLSVLGKAALAHFGIIKP